MQDNERDNKRDMRDGRWENKIIRDTRHAKTQTKSQLTLLAGVTNSFRFDPLHNAMVV